MIPNHAFQVGTSSLHSKSQQVKNFTASHFMFSLSFPVRNFMLPWPISADPKNHLFSVTIFEEKKQILQFFTICPQYKNANSANFVSAIPLEMTNEICKPWIIILFGHCYLISHLLTSYVTNREGNCTYLGIQS